MRLSSTKQRELVMVKVKFQEFLKLVKKINFVSVTVNRESPSMWWKRNSTGPHKISGYC